MKTQFHPFGVLARNPHKLNAGKLRDAYVTRNMLEMFEQFSASDCIVLALADMAYRKERYGATYDVSQFRLKITHHPMHKDSELYIYDKSTDENYGYNSLFIQSKVWDVAERVIGEINTDAWLNIIRGKTSEEVGVAFMVTMIEELLHGYLADSRMDINVLELYRSVLLGRWVKINEKLFQSNASV